MKKKLVAYFSRAGENYFGGKIQNVEIGNTEVLADEIRKIIDADIFKIEMKNPYSHDYMKCIEEAKQDLRNGIRPEILNVPDGVEKYDTILLGYPNYWGTMPMAVVRFLESFNFSGITIFPFCTHEGSGMGSSISDIKKYAEGSDVKNGLSIIGGEVKNSSHKVRKYLSENGLI